MELLNDHHPALLLTSARAVSQLATEIRRESQREILKETLLRAQEALAAAPPVARAPRIPDLPDYYDSDLQEMPEMPHLAEMTTSPEPANADDSATLASNYEP